jgi:hypothetical protein
MIRIVAGRRPDDFERDIAAEPFVAGPEDFSHAA